MLAARGAVRLPERPRTRAAGSAARCLVPSRAPSGGSRRVRSRRTDTCTAGRRELHRVRQHVPDDLLQPIGIARTSSRAVPSTATVERHLLRHRRRLHDLDGRVHDRGEVDRPHLEAQLAGDDARDFEQVLDQARLRPGRCARCSRARAPAWPARRALPAARASTRARRSAASAARATASPGTRPSAGSRRARARGRRCAPPRPGAAPAPRVSSSALARDSSASRSAIRSSMSLNAWTTTPTSSLVVGTARSA